MQLALLIVAYLFAAVNGANDGSAMLGSGLKVRTRVPPGVLLLVLLTALVAVPAVIGVRVASTLAERLVRFQGPEGDLALLTAVTVAVAVVALLSWRGLPTSLTLALVGAIAGAGWGAGLQVDGGLVAIVLVIGLLAPVVGGVGSWLLGEVLGRARAGRRLMDRLHVTAFSLDAVAYAANDGQKMLAVHALALGAASGVAPGLWTLVGLAAAFCGGVLLTLRRVSGRLTGGIVPTRPSHAVLGELSAAGAVLGSAALGAPVSMTQSLAGSLVGATVHESYRKVRWRVAIRLAFAWVTTLPAALALGAGIAWVVT